MINLTIATIVLFALYVFFAFSDYTVKFYNKRPGAYKVIGMSLFFAMSTCATTLIAMVFLVNIGVKV